VAQFAKAASLPDAEWQLTVLAYALRDLDAGHVARVVRPTKRKGRPPDSSVVWIMRVRVLTAMYVLQKRPMSQEKATRYINTKYPKLRRLMTRGKDLPGTILRWRRELTDAKPGTTLAPFAQELFDMEKDVENFSAPLSMTPNRWRQSADNMLAGIRP
jgi:hypothetical protein